MKQHIDITGIGCFKSPYALKVARLALPGFLGSVGCLGFIPGWHRLFGFFGFSGFFGFFGVAYIIESIYRGKNHHKRKLL